MELEQWLMVYQAITISTAGKERNYWMVTGIFLAANFLLLLPLAFFVYSYATWGEKWFKTALGAIGFLICFFWLASHHWAVREVSYWESLLRGIEGHFAGGEFHRSLYKLHQGEQVFIPACSWKGNEWYPEVERLSWLGRIDLRTLIGFLPIIFLLAWIALVVSVWLVKSQLAF